MEAYCRSYISSINGRHCRHSGNDRGCLDDDQYSYALLLKAAGREHTVEVAVAVTVCAGGVIVDVGVTVTFLVAVI